MTTMVNAAQALWKRQTPWLWMKDNLCTTGVWGADQARSTSLSRCVTSRANSSA
ncbi:hypothetical protein hbim_04192 [Mycolicibacterium mageritense]|uniref:Uncharacterized protein n=1 Tax=Mycolicibacterium mageritense TaxID=53462 RepID=A0AAI8XM41_MYCME|nr:hypothetical protein hbim_04192 [Mycolicibacterium mageritense]